MTHPRLTYVVCATPRVGSSLLCEALRRVPGAGSPREWFGRPRIHHLAGEWGLRAALSTPDEPALTDAPAYLDRVRREAQTDGVLSLKLHWNQVEWTRDRLGIDPIDVLGDLAAVGFVRLYREDLVAQTVSSFIASFTKVYVVPTDGPLTDDEFADVPRGLPEYDFDLMLDVLLQLAAIEFGWQPFFDGTGATAYVLRYEDLAGDLTGAVNGVLGHLGLPPERAVASPLVRQSTALNDELAARFRGDLRRRGVLDGLPAALRQRCLEPR